MRPVSRGNARLSSRRQSQLSRNHAALNGTFTLVALATLAARVLLCASAGFLTAPLLTGHSRRPLSLGAAEATGRSRQSALIPRADGSSLPRLKSFTVIELKKQLKEEGLPVSGKKADLIERLRAHREAQEEEPAGQPEEESGEVEGSVSEEVVAVEEEVVAEEVLPVKKADESTEHVALFQPGDSVDAYLEEENQWHPATVQMDHKDGTFMITWHKDEKSPHTCTAEQMKMKKKAPAPAEFFAGDRIEAYWEEDEGWHPARVKMNNGDGEFIIVWEEDGAEQQIGPDSLRHTPPKTPLRELKVGQRHRGKVERSFKFGTFVDIGAECNGLVAPYLMYEGEEEPLSVGDSVEAFYSEESVFYPGRIEHDHGSGKFTVVWDEDEEEYECQQKDIRLVKPASMEEEGEVDVWVSEVSVREKKLSLTLVESKVGKHPKQKLADHLSPFEGLAEDKWLQGTVASVSPLGVFVNVQPPKGGERTAVGLVHVSQIPDDHGENIEEDFEEGQEVKVRLLGMVAERRTMRLSMVDP